MICLIDNHDLEPLLGRLINLLCLGHLLQQVLNDDSVVVSDIRGCNLEVVNGRDDVELELPVAGGLEDAGIDFDLLNSWPIQFLQCRNDSSLLPCARWPVDEKMWEIPALCL